jgi:hypothetical protein
MQQNLLLHLRRQSEEFLFPVVKQRVLSFFLHKLFSHDYTHFMGRKQVHFAYGRTKKCFVFEGTATKWSRRSIRSLITTHYSLPLILYSAISAPVITAQLRPPSLAA